MLHFSFHCSVLTYLKRKGVFDSSESRKHDEGTWVRVGGYGGTWLEFPWHEWARMYGHTGTRYELPWREWARGYGHAGTWHELLWHEWAGGGHMALTAVAVS